MLLKTIAGQVEKIVTGLRYNKNELLVLNYHSTPKKFISDFEEQIIFLKKRFFVIAPSQLGDYYNGTLESSKCALLLTFDDGLKNNLYAADVLEKHNLTAFFFIVPQFANTPVQEQKNYYLKNIRPVVHDLIDAEPEDFTAITWDQQKALIKKGHAIGSHTYTHALVAEQSDAANSKHEIIESKQSIEQALDTEINSFCSINNTLLSVGKREKELIHNTYAFHFTTIPGLNAQAKNPLFIKRRNVEAFWPMGAVYYAIGKADLGRWKNKIEFFKNL